MKLLEHQAHSLLSGEFGIPTPRAELAFDIRSALEAFRRISAPVVVKAQVRSGGRGKAGGIRLATKETELISITQELLSGKISGQKVEAVLIQEAVEIAEEFFISLTFDRAAKCPCVLVSRVGGVEIEALAMQNPESLQKFLIDPIEGLNPTTTHKIADCLARDREITLIKDIIFKLYSAFIVLDAILVEINPLVRTTRGDYFALDAKIILDENALYRHPELLRLKSDSDSRLARAEGAGISFIPLEGEIGCIVNGAGLAMATMDAILSAGSSPANFLDIGGSSSTKKVETAFELIIENPDLKAIIINIFGGITRCDEVAKGIVSVKSKLNIRIPIFARISGTNSEQALELLAETDIQIAKTMAELIEHAVERVRGNVDSN